MTDVLTSKGVKVSIIDGANPANKDVRGLLFETSGKRAVYPQLFTKSPAGKHTFVADGDGFLAMIELNDKDHALDALIESLEKA